MSSDETTALSAHFTAADLIHAGETFARTKVANTPAEPATFAAMRRLCEDILEPVREKFGVPRLTYGFASPALTRHIAKNIFPPGDQHAGCELKLNGEPICPRLGQAVDFFVPGVSSAEIALWIVENLPFDRLYCYAEHRPLHVSVGPDESRVLVAMLPQPNGRSMPRVVTARWLRERIS